MEFEVIANVLKVEEMKSKNDETKVYHHVSVVSGDCVLPLKFVRQEVYDTCKAVGRLGTVKLKLLAVQTGTDTNNNPVYGFRALDCIVHKEK